MKQVKSFLTIIALMTMLTSAVCQTSKEHSNTRTKSKTIIWVKANKMDCSTGEIKKECYLIKNSLDQKEWDILSDEIIGLNYEVGYEYKIRIKTEKIHEPQAGASSIKNTLLKVISKKEIKGLPLSNQWIISSFNGQGDLSVPVSKRSFITINENEKKFNGNGACNNISGSLIVNGNQIKFEKIMATKMACEYLEQESKFLEALETVTNFKIIGCELFLFKGDAKILTLESCR